MHSLNVVWLQRTAGLGLQPAGPGVQSCLAAESPNRLVLSLWVPTSISQ